MASRTDDAAIDSAEPKAAVQPGDGQSKPDVTSAINKVFAEWNPSALTSVGRSHLHDLSRKSLEEVTRLTEYEDGKASRVLTAIAFLSGLAGGLNAALLNIVTMPLWLALPYHAAFLTFAVLIVAGAFIVIRAIRPRFNIKPSWSEMTATADAAVKGQEAPRSLLFAPIIIRASPQTWAEEFRKESDAEVEDLKLRSIKGHVHESYLIAEKVAEKLKMLQPGLLLFQWAVGVLLVWLLLASFSLGRELLAPADLRARGEGVMIFTDADNTLWDTNGLYAEAQVDLLERVEAATGGRAAGDRLAFVRRIDQNIARSHPAGLRYPPQLLVEALAAAVIAPDSTRLPATRPGSSTTRPALDPAAEADRYVASISRVPNLRPGVRAGLERMSSRGIPIYVVTEGSEGSALSRLSHYGLLPMIVGVVETRKSPEAFTDIIARYRNGSAVAFSVGDQLDRDIVYAHQAGLRTVYFPGEFVPEWLPDLADAKPDYQVVSFNEVADLALAHCDID